MRRHLPNLISALRFPLAAAFSLLAGMSARLAIIAAAAASDWIDGRVARATGSVSRTGAWLDPVADKTFMVVAVATLTVEAALPLWVLPVLLLRDIGVAAGAAVLALRHRTMAVPARRLGKWVTWLQFLTVALILIEPPLALWLAPAVGALGLLALRDYARSVTRSGRPRRGPDRGAPSPP